MNRPSDNFPEAQLAGITQQFMFVESILLIVGDAMSMSNFF